MAFYNKIRVACLQHSVSAHGEREVEVCSVLTSLSETFCSCWLVCLIWFTIVSRLCGIPLWWKTRTRSVKQSIFYFMSVHIKVILGHPKIKPKNILLIYPQDQLHQDHPYSSQCHLCGHDSVSFCLKICLRAHACVGVMKCGIWSAFACSSWQWQKQQAQDAGGGQGVLLAVPWPAGDGVCGGGQAVLIAHGSSKPLTFSRYPGKGDWVCSLLSDCRSWSLCWEWSTWRWPSSSYSTKLQQALNLPQVSREWRLGLAMLGTEYVDVTRQSLSITCIRLSTLPRYPERGDWVFVLMSDCGSWSPHNTQLQQTLNLPQVPRERWLGLCSHEWQRVLETSHCYFLHNEQWPWLLQNQEGDVSSSITKEPFSAESNIGSAGSAHRSPLYSEKKLCRSDESGSGRCSKLCNSGVWTCVLVLSDVGLFFGVPPGDA